MYDIGLSTAMTFAGLSITSTLLAAYGVTQRPASWGVLGTGSGASGARTLLTAAGITACFLPFTVLAILPTNNALFSLDDLAKRGLEVAGADVVELVERWGVLNYARAMIPLVGGIVSLSAL